MNDLSSVGKIVFGSKFFDVKYCEPVAKMIGTPFTVNPDGIWYKDGVRVSFIDIMDDIPEDALAFLLFHLNEVGN